MPGVADIREQDVIDGKYRVEKILRRAGGMGELAIVSHHYLAGVRFVMKFPRPEVQENDDGVARFLLEAFVGAVLDSKHIARVHDAGHCPRTGRAYVVMDFLQGQDLFTYVEEHGLPSPDEAIGWICQAARGLAAAHAQRIVHRDIKPSNLFVVPLTSDSKLIKVIDFGIAKVPRDLNPELDQQLTLLRERTNAPWFHLGTLGYISPEQWRSPSSVDERADVWSLAVVLYYLFTGSLPFPADSEAEYERRLLSQEPAPMAPLKRMQLSSHVVEVVQTALAMDRKARFPNMNQFAAALSPATATESIPDITEALEQRLLRVSLRTDCEVALVYLTHGGCWCWDINGENALKAMIGPGHSLSVDPSSYLIEGGQYRNDIQVPAFGRKSLTIERRTPGQSHLPRSWRRRQNL